ncbi:3-deoxy-D-manno-octulosonic-acid transferase [Runella defluvii]|uniref:3-deoxy-D-manno-octulosonic acid transferase n=1 Tax=Runella defluvii TaxID=370973 RepID=A0A7W5ZLT5_9BACT|nr:glycosyltransferase N-terminal domain-containing protein [Runella defluvii]MBB3838092.1 3-deoxy-D-manno-octulosonic-acid transferase [Runella defluvii]
MFAFFYTLGLHLLVFLANIVALFHPKTRKWVEGQRAKSKKQGAKGKGQEAKGKGQRAKKDLAFRGMMPVRESKVFWVHAASLGEFEQGRPVIEAIRAEYPHARIVLSFFSPSGYEIRKDYDQVDEVCYLPVDTPRNVKRFLDSVQPDVALFIKYEFWYNYLHELKKRQIPTFLFSAIFRPNQLFFKPYGGFYRRMLFCFNEILVQNEASKHLLNSVGYASATVAGDTRLDRVVQIAKQAKSYPEIEAFKGTDPLLVIGSAWPDDMEVLIPFLNQWEAPLKVIIAPHEINTEQIQQWQKALKKPSERFTVYGLRFGVDGTPLDILHSPLDILFLDTIGMLASLFRYADFAYVGGAFKDGLHNTMEPAVYGMPIFFGQPYYQKFQEALDLLQLGGATTIATTQEFTTAFTEVYQNLEIRQQKAGSCYDYVQKNAGATAKVMASIRSAF